MKIKLKNVLFKTEEIIENVETFEYGTNVLIVIEENGNERFYRNKDIEIEII